jgi:ActR/RegA family two-component response regulator
LRERRHEPLHFAYDPCHVHIGAAWCEHAILAPRDIKDYQLPDGDGLSILRHIKEQSPDTVAIMMTAHPGVENAVQAMKLGAFHYVTKPVDLEELALLVDKALETNRLRREVRAAKQPQPRVQRGCHRRCIAGRANPQVPVGARRGQPGFHRVAHW